MQPGLGVEMNPELIKELTVPLTLDMGVAHAGGVVYRASDVLAKL